MIFLWLFLVLKRGNVFILDSEYFFAIGGILDADVLDRMCLR